MSNTETRWQATYRSIFALVCCVFITVGWLVYSAFKLAFDAAAWVGQAFRDLLEDETHLDKMKEQMTNKPKGGD